MQSTGLSLRYGLQTPRRRRQKISDSVILYFFTARSDTIKRKSYHTVKVGDSRVFVGIRVKQHLGVGMDGDVRFDTFLVRAQELGDGLDLRFGLREGAAIGVIAGMGGCTLS